MKIIYKTEVKEPGLLVHEFKDSSMFITFGENAPDTLKDYCYVIETNTVDGEILVDQIIRIDGVDYFITAVGDCAKDNLEGLGHLTVSFSGEVVASLPGTVYVEKSAVPSLQLGSVIEFIS